LVTALMTAHDAVAGTLSDPWMILRSACLCSDLTAWNDRQTDVGAVLGMTLEALITELCK
jgi:hypothetical protein